MLTSAQGHELSVAILMDDLASAKEISVALRNQGVFAHHYQQLDEFWAASNIQTPDLLFVDVTKLAQGSIQLKHHPKVTDGSLAFVLFSKDSTKILLNSTLSLKPFGYLHRDATLANQVEGIILKRSRGLAWERESKEMDSRLQRLQARSQRMLTERSQAEEFKAHFEFIKNISNEIEEAGKKNEFLSSLASKLDDWDLIESYGFYELNANSQKLVSPQFSKKKFHPFPSLWLGEPNQQGIKFFAEEMALQVALDLFENRPQVLRIFGGRELPELLVYVTSKISKEDNFPWSLFEFMISSALRKLQIQNDSPKQIGQFLNSWEGLDLLDRIQFDAGQDVEMRVIGMSLLPLCEVIKKRVNNKFYWSNFYNELVQQFSTLLQKNTKISNQGPWQILIYVRRENIEMEFNVLQMIIKNLSVWKFFEDDSQVLTENLNPQLKLLPASSAHYLRSFEKEIQDSIFASETKLTQFNSKKMSKTLV